MGAPVLIQNMIQRIQEILNGNSNIIYTGLREGEKLHEDLFAGVEDRSQSIPGLIESSSHVESLRLNSDLVTIAKSQTDSELISYLTQKD